MAQVLFRSRLQVWRDVLFAIFLREIKSKYSDKFGIAWAVLQPLAFILILSFIRGRMDGDETHSMPTFVFMAYGILSVRMFLNVLKTSSKSFSAYKPLFAFRQVQPISAILAPSFLELITYFFVIFFLGIFMYFLQIEIVMNNPLLVMFNLIILFFIALFLGTIFGIIQAYIPEFKKIQSMMTRPLFFISGIFFSLQDMPQEIWVWFLWNPILHAIELSRDAAYPEFGAVGVSYPYFLSCFIVIVFFGLALYKISWAKVISR